MEPTLLGHLKPDPSLSVFAPERCAPGMHYAGLHCPCGSTRFMLAGWPRVASGGGSFFWRSVARVFREARTLTHNGEPVESPYWLPLFAICARCGQESRLLEGESVEGRMPSARRGDPRESYRCRVCRRSEVALAFGYADDPGPSGRSDFEVFVCCERCQRQARIAWSEGRPSEQEVRLDLLYGRR